MANLGARAEVVAEGLKAGLQIHFAHIGAGCRGTLVAVAKVLHVDHTQSRELQAECFCWRTSRVGFAELFAGADLAFDVQGFHARGHGNASQLQS